MKGELNNAEGFGFRNLKKISMSLKVFGWLSASGKIQDHE